MITRSKFGIMLMLLLVSAMASAQNIQVDDTYTPQQLVEDVLINSSCASISNVSVSGIQGDEKSYGYFSGTGTTFPFANGIILSTGRATQAQGPNTYILDDGNDSSWEGDQDLEDALNVNIDDPADRVATENATILEFDFVPLSNSISFDYMMSSEEYHGTAPCRYSDGFAFLLKEADTNNPYQNLAVIPGTNDPVKVTSVHPFITRECPAINEQYFDAFNGTEHPTNFNGQTTILTASATVTPRVRYHIKLVIADEDNYRYDSAIFIGGGSFNLGTSLGTDRLLATNNPICNGEQYTIDATTENAIAYQWYKNDTIINGATGSTYTVDPVRDLSPEGTYTAEITFSPTCISKSHLKLEYAPPLAVGTYILLQCDEDNDGLTLFDLERAGLLIESNVPDIGIGNYFLTLEDAEANTNELPSESPYQNTRVNQNVYVRVQNRFGCTGIATVTLATSNNTVRDPATIEECDVTGTDDGFTSFDLTTTSDAITTGLPAGVTVDYYPTYNDALTFTNRIANPQNFINTTAYNQTLYARVSSGADCYGIASVPLVVHSFGSELNDEKLFLCQNVNSILLDAGSGFTSYTWNTNPPLQTQEIAAVQPGTYTVTVTNDFNCTGTKTFTVTASGQATGADIKIDDFTGNNNSITIITQGTGTYEYSLNGTQYQDSPIFNDLDAGQYTVYIKDINGCGPVFRKSVVVLDYPKYFTPNGDAINELWTIPYMRNRPGLSVTIYDRFGKLITSFNGLSLGWDGTLDGSKFPATDYWFVITLEDNRTVKGHFALIR
jgi:gliding motility-associated-like protein